MIITLADTISRATTLAGGRTDWVVSDVSFYANVAAQTIYQQVYHTPQEALAYSSTTSGENRISVPTDYDGSISLSNLSGPINIGWAGGRQLTKREGAWISSQWTGSGEPTHYADYGTWMELWPTPDSSYSLELRYYAKLPTMVASTATPHFDERWHPGWLYKTWELLEQSRNNPEGAAVARNQYLDYMGSVPSDLARRQVAKEGRGLRYQRVDG
jgi:hypothetical protein